MLLDVFPEIELKEESYKGLKVQVERVPFNDEAYDMSLFKLRDQNANLYDAEPGQARVIARLATHGPARPHTASTASMASTACTQPARGMRTACTLAVFHGAGGRDGPPDLSD